MRVVEGGAFLQENAERGVEFCVCVWPLGGLFFEQFEKTFGDDLVQFLDERFVLHGLARDVQREILAIDHALHEAQPLGEKILRFGVDQHFAAKERNGWLQPGEAQLLGIFLRDEEQGVDRERGVGGEMQAQAGLVVGVGLELVELGVLLFLDLGLTAEPECLDGVELGAVERDGETDEGAVPGQDFLELPFLGEVGALVFELDHDFATALLALALFDLVRAGTVARPELAGLILLPRVGVNLDALGRHERAVETDAELADEIGVFRAAFTEGLQKSFGAGVGDRAEVFDELRAGHANAGVLEGDGLRLVVRSDINFQGDAVVLDILLGQLQVAEFFEGIGGIGHQFADEDFFLRVERVDDDIEQLLDLGLEFEFLRSGGGHGGGSVKVKVIGGKPKNPLY